MLLYASTNRGAAILNYRARRPCHCTNLLYLTVSGHCCYDYLRFGITNGISHFRSCFENKMITNLLLQCVESPTRLRTAAPEKRSPLRRDLVTWSELEAKYEDSFPVGASYECKSRARFCRCESKRRIVEKSENFLEIISNDKESRFVRFFSSTAFSLE